MPISVRTEAKGFFKKGIGCGLVRTRRCEALISFVTMHRAYISLFPASALIGRLPLHLFASIFQSPAAAGLHPPPVHSRIALKGGLR